MWARPVRSPPDSCAAKNSASSGSSGEWAITLWPPRSRARAALRASFSAQKIRSRVQIRRARGRGRVSPQHRRRLERFMPCCWATGNTSCSRGSSAGGSAHRCGLSRGLAMLDALGVNDPAADRAALASEGFPATVTTSTDSTSDDDYPFAPDEDPFAPTTSWTPDLGTAVEPSASTGTRSSYEDHYNAWRPSYTPIGYRPPVVPAPPGNVRRFPCRLLDPARPWSRACEVSAACRCRAGVGGVRILVHGRRPPSAQARFHQRSGCHVCDRGAGGSADDRAHRPAVLPTARRLLRLEKPLPTMPCNDFRHAVSAFVGMIRCRSPPGDFRAD